MVLKTEKIIAEKIEPGRVIIKKMVNYNLKKIIQKVNLFLQNVGMKLETKQTANKMGEFIYIENLESFEGEYMHSFNLSEYSKGIYLLELDTENGIVHKKLILQ